MLFRSKSVILEYRIKGTRERSVHTSFTNLIHASHSLEVHLTFTLYTVSIKYITGERVGFKQMNERILLAESDPTLRSDLSRYLLNNQYTVESIGTGANALLLVQRFSPDLLILDAHLPSNGAPFYTEIRKLSSIPIILTSPNATVADRVNALESGVDDFLLTPCDMRELGARMKAVLRRSRISSFQEEEGQTINLDRFSLSIEEYELRLNGKRIDLTPKELQLLYFLASNPNKVYTRDQLLDKVWGYNYLGNTRTIDAHVRKVREKCNGVSDKWAIRTVWGVGYKFEIA